jgi:hypothetical protein
MAESAGVRVPGGDYGAYAESHVRRLEALRRAGIVERVDADHWRIPGDFETRAGDYDAQRRGRMTLRLLSNIDLEAQIDANGVTWLDRELASPNRTPLVRAGFGAEASRTLERRKEALVDKGHAWRAADRAIRAPKDLVARMERQELERVGKSLAAEKRSFPNEGRRRPGLRRLHRHDKPRLGQIRRDRKFLRVHPRPLTAGHGRAARTADQRRCPGFLRLMGFRAEAWARNRDVSAQSRPLRFLIWLKSSPMLGYM